MDTNRDLSWMCGEIFQRSVREIFPPSDCMIYPNDIVYFDTSNLYRILLAGIPSFVYHMKYKGFFNVDLVQ